MQTFKKLPIEAPMQKAIVQRNQAPGSAAAGVMATSSVLTAIVRRCDGQTRKRERGMDLRPSPVVRGIRSGLAALQRRVATARPGAGVARSARVRARHRERGR